MTDPTYTYPSYSSPKGPAGWIVDMRNYIDEQVMGGFTRVVAGTTYTTVLGDAGRVIETTNAAAVTITIPLNSSVNYKVPTYLEFLQYGTGQITIAGAAGVTVRPPVGFLGKSAVQYASLIARQRATNEWMLDGHIV